MLAATWLLCACGSSSDGPIREWKPEDHQAPPTVADEGRAAPPSQAEATAPEERIALAVYAAKCARCHGDDGRGTGPELPPGAPIPDFTSAAFHQQRNDNALAQTIVQGRGMMPAFGEELSPNEIALVIGVVRGFGPPAAQGDTGGGKPALPGAQAGDEPAPAGTTADDSSPEPSGPAGGPQGQPTPAAAVDP